MTDDRPPSPGTVADGASFDVSQAPASVLPDALLSHGGLTAVDPWDARAARSGAGVRLVLGGVVETLDVLILALAMFLCVRFVAHNYVVEGGSMLPTFHQSDLVIVNRLAYRSFDLSWIPGVSTSDWRPFGEPDPGDVIVFEYSGDPNHRDFIKRVIATPGQSVEVRDGVVLVDGEALDEPYIAELGNYSYPLVIVGPGKLFVLGDNRNNSLDSHIFGFVDESTVIGRADFRYWPAGRWGLVSHALDAGGSLLGIPGIGWAAAWR